MSSTPTQLLANFSTNRSYSSSSIVTMSADEALPDPYGPLRLYLFGLLRLPGEENEFKIEGRVTDYMLFILKQWADGRFINEIDESWLNQHPDRPDAPSEPPKLLILPTFPQPHVNLALNEFVIQWMSV